MPAVTSRLMWRSPADTLASASRMGGGVMVRDTLAEMPDEDTFIGALRPLTAGELQAVVAGTTTDRVSIKVYLASAAVALLLSLLLPMSLKPLAFPIGIIVLVLLVLKILGHVTNRDVRRDIAAGQKVVINGFVKWGC